MSRIDVELGERHECLRVDGFEQEHAGGCEGSMSLPDEANDVDCGEMLDELSGEDAAERIVRNSRQVVERAPLLDDETLFAAVFDHPGVKVDSASLDVGLAEKLEKLS